MTHGPRGDSLPARARILLAEDHQTVREGLKLILNDQEDLEVVAEAGDGANAIATAAAVQPDIIVLDISMPGLNGLAVAERVRDVSPASRIVVLTRHADAGYLEQLLTAGASGYVLKQSSPSELLRAIRAVLAGGTYLDPMVAGQVVDPRRRRPRGAAPVVAALTGRESEVLRLIAWGYSNKEIASQLDLSVKTVETHKANAMHKLRMTSRIDIVRYALLQGWLHES